MTFSQGFNPAAAPPQSITIEEAIQIARGHLQANRLIEAEQLLRQALAAAPHWPELLNQLGLAVGRQGRYAEALDLLERATRLNPLFVIAWQNMAVAAEHLLQFDRAVFCAERAVELEPKQADSHFRLAQALRRAGRYDESARAARSGLALRPGDPEMLGVLAEASLMLGDMETGWEAYEARWECATFPEKRRDWAKIKIDTTSLAGKHVAVYGEQGYGDFIQFLRYIPLLIQAGARVTVMTSPDLRPLALWIPDVEQVRTTHSPVEADYLLPLMSLPHVFGTRLSTIPANIPYLRPPETLVEKWKGKLAPYPGLKIGLAWAGRPSHKHDKERSVRLEQFLPIAQVPGVTLFSLQKGPAAAQANLPPAGMQVVNLTGGLADFADTAGFVANLDLVIAVDTAVVHLAGAMGKSAWVLLSARPDWRWLLNRHDSPWYPDLRLYRQTTLGAWDEVLQQVAADLRQRVAYDGGSL